MRTACAATGFCSIHTPLKGDRVKCEFCGHMVKANCRRHYNVCGVRRTPIPCYVRPGFNKFPVDDHKQGAETGMGSADGTERELQRRVIQLFQSFAAPMLVDGGWAHPRSAPLQRSAKHRMQEAAICEVMRQHGMVAERADGGSSEDGNNRFYLDLGAGKGCLSKAVSAINSAFPRSTYICVEKAAYKHKAEQTKYARTRRARVDICDVDVFKLLQDTIRECPESACGTAGYARAESERGHDVVGMGKHLCGSATDLALMSLKNVRTENLKDDNFSVKIEGICIAVCCHAASTWDCTAARPWLEKQGIGEAEFELIRHWSGYFTDNLLSEEHPSSADACPGGYVPPSTAGQAGADDSPESASFGRMCKRLLDYGRVEFIRNELGLEARLCTYIGQHVTPENVLLVAWPPT